MNHENEITDFWQEISVELSSFEGELNSLESDTREITENNDWFDTGLEDYNYSIDSIGFS